MITFGLVENRLRFLGILNIRSTTSLTHSLMNIGYRAIVWSTLFVVFISSSWFIFFEATTYDEFTQLASVTVVVIIGLALYISLFYEKPNIIQLMNDLNELIEKSEYRLSSDWKYLLNNFFFFFDIQELKVIRFMKKQLEKLKSR